MAQRFALLTSANLPPQTDDEKNVTTTLLHIERGLSAVLDSSPAPAIPTGVFRLLHASLTDATTLSLFNHTNAFLFLTNEENDYWNMDPSRDYTPAWTLLASNDDVPRGWIGELLKQVRVDLHVEQVRLWTIMQNNMPANVPQLAPRGGTPIPPPDDFISQIPQTEQHDTAFPQTVDPRFTFTNSQVPNAPRLSECARPLSAFLTGPKTAATQRAVQVSYGEDNSFIVAAPQQTRSNESITYSMFHCASQRMQNTVYIFLDLHLFHNNILSNYMDKYTMPSILSDELAVRQMIPEQPPGTRFQSAYLELGALHLESFTNFHTRQKLLALESSGAQQRSSYSYGQQINTPTYRTPSTSAQPRQPIGVSSFPPCHNFATGECSNLRAGKCTRDHACAACGKAYPAQRCCPAGHKGEEVCPGVTELIAQRLSNAKRPFFPDTAGGGGKRSRGSN